MKRWASLFICGLTLWLADGVRAQTVPAYHDRADKALQSFLLKFWDGSNQYLRHRYPADGTLTGYWTYANGWDAAMDGVERTGKLQYLGWVETFYIGQNERGWGSDYYDDLCWMTMALIRAYDLTGDIKYLNQAKTIFTNVQNAWDVSCCGGLAGGVWWDKAHTQKATASNAGAALAAVKLYRCTNGASYLAFARQVFSFWSANMVDPNTGQVCDHITPTGEKVWWKFTYNEGLMIGAAVELYDATSETNFLTQAHKYAGFMVFNEALSTSYGNVLNDGSNTGCAGDCAQFKGPAYRYLTQLQARDPRTAYQSVLRSSDDAIWFLARDSATDTFARNWAGPTESIVEMMEQNVAASALSRYAQQLGTASPAVSNDIFEAENAVIHHIPLENIYAGFHGWGYLAGWNGPGQVDFVVNFPATATYTLNFRYAAGAGNASRQLLLNGIEIAANLSFTGTGAWNTYNTASFTRAFGAGPNTISLKFDSTRGSANWLNFDYLQIPNYVPPPPGPLKIKQRPPFLEISWTGPGFLQTLPGVGGWVDVNGSPSSPATIPMDAATTRFYRVRR